MTAFTFIKRGIWHHKVSYLGVLAGAALGAAVLLGALMAGDSVKETLRKVASDRIGQVDYIFVASEGFFRDELAADVRHDGVETASVLFLKGQLSAQESGRALSNVQIVGVDEAFWKMAPDPDTKVGIADREVAINGFLAASLDLAAGESVVLRLQEPGKLSRDAPMSGEAEDVISFRAKVKDIVGDDRFGRFTLEATQLPVPTVYVPIARLQKVIEYPAKANMILLNVADPKMEALILSGVVRNKMTLEDYGLTFVDIPLAKSTEIRSERIFLETEIVDAVSKRYPGAQPVVSYLANTLAANGKETPYSMVTAAGPEAAPFLPADFAADEVVINSWLANDLGATPGQEFVLKFFQLGSGNRLAEGTRKFTIKSVVPMEGLAADRLWMPDFPGVAEAENAEDWATGLPIDRGRIHDEDEDYWDEYRGTPKAFVSVEAGREMFGNRWGEFTSMRIPVADAHRDSLEAGLLPVLRPEMAGLLLRDLRGDALEAAESPVDIAGLFLSMSFFLIVASVTLTAMLFRFNVEQRNRESGLLAALGVSPKKVLRWRLMEGLLIVTVGGFIGLAIAIAYSIGILRFLETIWSSDAGGSLFSFHVNPASVIWGFVGFVGISMLVIWLTVRKQAKKSASLRLEAGEEEVRRGGSKVVAVLLSAAVSVFLGMGCFAAKDSMGPQGAFFLSGVFFLIAGLLGYRAWLGWSGSRAQTSLTPGSLAILNSGRRPMRSLVVVGTLACGVFLVISVTAFRKHGGEDWAEKASGAGGYAYWIETTNPVNRAADAQEEPDYFELGDDRGLLGDIFPIRVGVGDDASCFNLNKATRPRLLALNAGTLATRESFTLKKVAEGLEIESGWKLLEEPAGENVLRAFIDETTLMWVLKMKVGDRITYTDEKGAPFEVEIAGALSDSVFQGHFLVQEEAFLNLFPSQQGYSLFLAEVSGKLAEASGDLDEIRAKLQKATADRGSTVSLTRERLAGFHGVENTYIAIFHVLGGLGLILGSAGIGIVTARNLAERRVEFGVLETVGISHRVTKSVIFKEVHAFIGWALLIGLVASVVAIVPALTGTPPMKTLAGLSILVVLIGLNSLVWAWVGYRAGYRRRAGFV